MAVIPPALGVIKIWLKRITLTRPCKAAPADPTVPEGVDVLRRAGQRLTNPSRYAVVKLESAISHAGVMIPHGHCHIAGVPSHDDVLNLGKEGQAIQGQMGFHKTAVLLRF